jgi:hypothetical protein
MLGEMKGVNGASLGPKCIELYHLRKSITFAFFKQPWQKYSDSCSTHLVLLFHQGTCCISMSMALSSAALTAEAEEEKEDCTLQTMSAAVYTYCCKEIDSLGATTFSRMTLCITEN